MFRCRPSTCRRCTSWRIGRKGRGCLTGETHGVSQPRCTLLELSPPAVIALRLPHVLYASLTTRLTNELSSGLDIPSSSQHLSAPQYNHSSAFSAGTPTSFKLRHAA